MPTTVNASWTVYRVGDGFGCWDWWLARSAEEALAAARELIDDVRGEEVKAEHVHALTDEDLARMELMDEDTRQTQSFAAVVAQRVREGIRQPECIASTEY